MASVDLATELMDNLVPIPYNQRVTALNEDLAMNSKIVQTLKSSLKGKYEFNSEVFRARNGTPKPNGMFDLFAKYSGAETSEIRKDMIKFAREHCAELSAVCKEAFSHKRISFNAWAVKLSLRNSVCDEIALYILCKLYSRHAIVYATKDVWTTVQQSNWTSSEIEAKCDLMFIYTDKGFTLCKRLADVTSKEDESGTAGNTAKVKSSGKVKRKTISIHTVIKETEDREKEKLNKVSAKLNVENILPDTERSHNTRKTTPLRRRHNAREQRLSCENFNYSDNLDEHHLDSPPTKKAKIRNVPKTLREPSALRQNAQRIITRGELQRSASPEVTRKLIGTYIKDKVKDENEGKMILKLQIKEEEERTMNQVNTRRKNKSWPKDARLVHVDRTPCSEECMKTHSDEDSVEPVLNKSSVKTYGKSSTESPSTATLAGIPAGDSAKTVVTENQQKSADRNIDDSNPNANDDQRTAQSSTQSVNKTGDNSTAKVNFSLDTVISTEDQEINTNTSIDEPVLPDIEKLEDPEKSQSKNIDLEEDLSAKNVNQIDSEILDELSEFSNLLNLDEERDGLPLVASVNSTTDSAMDLEIEMENTKFLEKYPAVSVTSIRRRGHPRQLATAIGPVLSGTAHNSASPIATSTYSAATVNKAVSTNMVASLASGTPCGSTASAVVSSTPTTKKSRKGTVHITTHVLRRPTPEEAKTKKFKCKACEFTGYSRATISTHYAASHPPCYCSVCGKVYSNPNALARHMYVHDPDKPYQCDDCQQSFSFESELVSHRMKHRTGPSFTCMFHNCGKKFRRMSELNSHVVEHSGRMYNCKKCNYNTNNPRHLRDHQRSHSDEKRYKCKYCEERFKYTSGRIRHYEKEH